MPRRSTKTSDPKAKKVGTTKVSKPKKQGRPKEYDQAYVDKHVGKLADMFREGQTIEEVAAELGMCKQTFYYLKQDFPEWKEQLDLGLTFAHAWVLKQARLAACGENPHCVPQVLKSLMHNRCGYTDNKQVVNTPKVKKADENDW